MSARCVGSFLSPGENAVNVGSRRFAGDANHFVMNGAVGSEGFVVPDGKRRAGELSQHAAGFRHNQSARSDIPGL